MKVRIGQLSCVVAVLALGTIADVSSAALSQQQGGSGYSGTLSSNRRIRRQQLICDPAAAGVGGPSTRPVVNPFPGAPVAGSTSVTYDPSIVSLTGLLDGPSYGANGQVAVNNDGRIVLQNIYSFLEAPLGPEVGYVQIGYERSLSGGSEAPSLTLHPLGTQPGDTPGQMAPPPEYVVMDRDGVAGFDTHAFFFDYREGVADTTVATYNIFAATEGQFYGNQEDFVYGTTLDGQEFTLGPGDLSSATVSGSLVPNVVPLPPAAWAGAVMLAGVVLAKARRRLVA